MRISSLASVAQLVEHPTDTRAVVGSTPTACTQIYLMNFSKRNKRIIVASASTLAALGIIVIKVIFTSIFDSSAVGVDFFGFPIVLLSFWGFLKLLVIQPEFLVSLIGPELLVFIAIWIIAVWVWALPKKDEELVTKLKQSSDVSEYDA